MNPILPQPFHPCQDRRDAVLLHKNRGLYLTPAASLHLRVQWPAGRAVSSLDLLETIKSLAQPDQFISLKDHYSSRHLFLQCKVTKSSPDCMDFEAELENRHQIKTVLQRLDLQTFRVNGFPDIFRIRGTESKINHPFRQDWDSFFQNAPNMNQLKAGERPDTVRIKGLPCAWFSPTVAMLNEKSVKPSETVLRDVFETFGPLSAIDIPLLDPFREKIHAIQKKMMEPIKEGLFDAYIQYQEYGSFAKCMSAFRGMKLLYDNGQFAWTVPIEVDFDRTKHLSEISIQERKRARARLLQEEIDHERAEKRRREAESKRASEADVQKRNEEEEKVALEERKLVLAQRRVESLRLLDFLLERVKVANGKGNQQSDPVCEKEPQLRSKLMVKVKEIEEQRLEQQKDKLRSTVDSCHIRLNKMASLRVKEPDPVIPEASGIHSARAEESRPPASFRNGTFHGRDGHFRRPHRHLSDLDELWHGPNLRNPHYRKPYSRFDKYSGKFRQF